MEFDPEYLLFGVIMVLLANVGAAAVGINMPGTIELNNPLQGISGGNGDDTTRCTLKTKVSVAGVINGARLNKDSFRIASTRPTGFLASAMAGNGQMSWFGTSDVEVKFTLNGPIDTSRTVTRTIGDLGATAETTVSFKATNLPPGTYHLHHILYHAKGSDYLEAVINIRDGCSSSLKSLTR